MKNILAKRELSRLEQFVRHDTLIAFEFDGALAPIARDPAAARLRKTTWRLLDQVARRYPTAVISGRPRADVLARLNGAPVKAVVGNHGLEPSPDAARYHGLVKVWMPRLREALNDQSGIEIENKLYTLSIHYRRSRTKVAARAAIERAVRQLGPEVRATEGKLVTNVLPSDAPNKSHALQYLRSSLRAQQALFIGEDITAQAEPSDSENSNGAAPPQHHLLGVRVGRNARSQATHYLSTQADIDQLLKRLLEFS